MQGQRAKCLIPALLIGLIGGCQHHRDTRPFYAGPTFELSASSSDARGNLAGQIVKVSSETALPHDRTSGVIRMVDARPQWQRVFYNGSDAIQDWAIAQTIIPMENFRPDVLSQIRSAVEYELAERGIETATFEVQLVSFECVLDLCDEQHARFDRWISETLAMRRKVLAKPQPKIGVECGQSNFSTDQRQDRSSDRWQHEQNAALRNGTKSPDRPKDASESIFGDFIGALVGQLLVVPTIEAVVSVPGAMVSELKGLTTTENQIRKGKGLPQFKGSDTYQLRLAPEEQYRTEYPSGQCCLIRVRVARLDQSENQTIELSAGTRIKPENLDESSVVNVVSQTIQSIAEKIAISIITENASSNCLAVARSPTLKVCGAAQFLLPIRYRFFSVRTSNVEPITACEANVRGSNLLRAISV